MAKDSGTAQVVGSGFSRLESYEFSTKWFESVRPIFKSLFSQVKPARVLEIGSFEGASAVYMIETLGALAPLEIHCIDTWQGGIEHQRGRSFEANMSDVETRFARNTALAVNRSKHPINLCVHKGRSISEMAKLIAQGHAGSFDFIYIDGSHQAPDVLNDAILAFELLKVQGIMGFDDYLWSEDLPGGIDPLRCPKLAIDLFTNVFARKVKVMNAPLTQMYLRKTADSS